MPPFFTVAEAEALLPRVEAAIREAIDRKRIYMDAENTVQEVRRRVAMAGGSLVDVERIRADNARRDSAAVRLNHALETIHDFGCEVKDLDIGLLDFRTLYRGSAVYLCWKLGERRIEYWHGLEEGFRGRKPIDEEFLANHHA